MDDSLKLAILGVGSLRCFPPVLSSLASYYGERPIEVRLYDADEERLDLMDRFARTCFQMTRSSHEVRYRPDAAEALENADRIVLMVGRNCARKFSKMRYGEGHADINATLAALLEKAPAEADVLSLERKSVVVPLPLYHRMEWPGEPSDEDLRWLPHQILRWLKGEEMMYEFLAEQESSPFKAWLNDPNSAELVINRTLSTES